MGGYQSGQMGQTVTLLSQDFEGSNPSPPTPIKLKPFLKTERFFYDQISCANLFTKEKE